MANLQFRIPELKTLLTALIPLVKREQIAVRFFTSLKLGPNRDMTPEGFLLCRNVPIARTGIQLYGPGETPIQTDGAGMVRVHRRPEDVFRPQTVASFNGKPFVLDHPTVDVTPENWRDLAKGVILDPRQGSGAEDDLLIADVLVYDPEAIQMIQEEGVSEVSAGYDAAYVEDSAKAGEGYQVDILGNHVALVRNGRCGPRCSIRDEEVPVKSKTSWQKFRDSITTAFQTKDEKALDSALAEMEKDGEPAKVTDCGCNKHHDADPDDKDDKEKEKTNDVAAVVKAMDAGFKLIGDRLDKLEAKAKDAKAAPDEEDDDEDGKEKKDKTGDSKDENPEGHNQYTEGSSGPKKKRGEKSPEWEEYNKSNDSKDDDDVKEETSDSVRDDASKVTDSRYMEESVQATMSAAEILTPGIQFPTFDSTAAPKDTVNSLTSLRKKSLGIFASTTEGATILAELRGGKPLLDGLTTMSVHDTRQLFFAAAAQAKQQNRERRVSVADEPTVVPGKVLTIAEMNRRNREFWKGRVN
jgi:hypothetical protein